MLSFLAKTYISCYNHVEFDVPLVSCNPFHLLQLSAGQQALATKYSDLSAQEMANKATISFGSPSLSTDTITFCEWNSDSLTSVTSALIKVSNMQAGMWVVRSIRDELARNLQPSSSQPGFYSAMALQVAANKAKRRLKAGSTRKHGKERGLCQGYNGGFSRRLCQLSSKDGILFAGKPSMLYDYYLFIHINKIYNLQI